MTKVKVGITGGAGYTGGEMIRLLLQHEKAEIVFVHSRSHAGDFLYVAHPDLFGETEQIFADEISQDIDVLFLCLGHGESRKFLLENYIESRIRIIDLSNDFRLSMGGKNILGERTFTYGLPELNGKEICKAVNIANPGCFATAIELALIPFASNKMFKSDIHISGITGSTGAGHNFSETSHFSWRNGNIAAYKIMEHQHLFEIKELVEKLQGSFNGCLHFIPYRGNFTRGIMVTSYFHTVISADSAYELYRNYYRKHPFVHVTDQNPSVKQVVNSNKCILYLEKHGDNLVVISVLDNLLKGSSGQAVQNMNLIFGMEETEGLKLKTVNF
jgi:N-acetyl-gamma-glutamyl-phosphate reductase